MPRRHGMQIDVHVPQRNQWRSQRILFHLLKLDVNQKRVEVVEYLAELILEAEYLVAPARLVQLLQIALWVRAVPVVESECVLGWLNQLSEEC